MGIRVKKLLHMIPRYIQITLIIIPNQIMNNDNLCNQHINNPNNQLKQSRILYNYLLQLHIMAKYKPLLSSLQENTDIGYVPINTQSSYEFSLDNKNQFPVPYRWKHTVFHVEPSSGILLPKTHNQFRIVFTTQEAVVVIGTVVLETDHEEPRVFKMSVIGKYSNLGCTNQPIEFPATTVGRINSKKVIIKNSSVVPSSFKIKNQTTSHFKDNPFSVTPSHGEIPPKSSYELDIRYSPMISDAVYNGKLVVESESGNNLSLIYHAKSVSFDVSLTPKSINFGEVKLQSTTNRAITLYNNSDADTDYQFFCQVGNVFSINEFKGTIPSNSFKKVIVQFDPKNTICYYQRLYCIVRNHRLLYVDLMGTCYDLLIKPLPIVQIHVDLFRRRVIEGRLSEIDFKYLESNLQIKINKKLELLRDEKSLMSLEVFDLPEINFQESEAALHKQLFLEGTENQLITLSTDFIDFGHCDTMTISSQQQLLVTNNFPCKITVYWINQKRENFNGAYMTAFQIYPESATLKPGASVKFSISFRPLKSQYFFFQHFQFFALKQGGKMSKKTLEEYEKKELRTLKPEVTLLKTLKVTQTIQSKVTAELETAEVMPPIQGVLRCVGNSFGIPSSAYIPIMKLFPSKNVLFAPSKIGESTYQTVELINHSDTPTYFKVSPDVNKIFRVFPKAGLIEGKSFQILTFEFTPKACKNYNHTLPIHLNGSNGNPMMLSLIGQCPQPKLRIPHNKLFFSKCFLGVYSKQTFTIQNLSRLPINFKAEIPQKYQDQVFLNISQKKLQSNEILQIELCFIPQYKKQYKIKIPIKISEEEKSTVIGYYQPGSGMEENPSLLAPPKEEEYYIEVFGEGGDGSLVLEKQEIDFGVVKVLEQKKIQVKLTNLSDCTFYIEQALKSNTKDNSNHEVQSSFSMDSSEGTLVAKGSTLIGITFSPLDVKDFDVSLIISAREKYPKALKLPSKNINVAKCSLLIKAQGSYPLLQAVDIRNDGLSVTALWESFQLSSFNHSMSTNLTPYEKKYLNIETLPFTESQALQQKLVTFNWNFGYISHKNASKPRRVLLTIKNFGGIDLDYNFKFPFDNAIEKQIWADPGEPTKEQAYEKAVVAKNIFEVRPKSGQLKPGEFKDIVLTYTPASISNNKNANQQHSLRTVLEIKNGKAMVINLKGTTLGPQEGLLVVKKKTYVLPNTPIGMITPLQFPIQLQNVGSAKISYTAVIEYKVGEFEEVFGIVNPSGALANLQKDFIYCRFKPLEIKQYRFQIIIHVYNTDKVQTQRVEIEMRGRGVGKVETIPKSIKLSKQIPSQRSLVSDLGSKVFFSIQEIDFSVVKPLQTTYKMIIVYNLSTTKSLTFDFPEQNISEGKNSFTCGDKFLIEPNNGEILPGQFVELKITLTAEATPSCYEGEIECHIAWNNKETQEAGVNKLAEKEVLFLRVKKQAEMSFVNNDISPRFSPDLTLFQNIFSNIIKSSLTNTNLLTSFKDISHLPPGIVDFLHQDSGASIQNVNGDIEGAIAPRNEIDNSNFKAMFVNEEFLGVGEIILENTFFNIIQETTHRENDLMRVTKKFITNNRNVNELSHLQEDEG